MVDALGGRRATRRRLSVISNIFPSLGQDGELPRRYGPSASRIAHVAVGRPFLDLWSSAPRTSCLCPSFSQSVRLGESVPQKKDGGPHARVPAGLTFLSTHLRLEFDIAIVSPALVASCEKFATLARGPRARQVHL